MRQTKTVEFGYFAPTGSDGARGRAFSPALQRAVGVASEAFTSLWLADHFMFESADVNEAWVELSYLAGLAPRMQIGHMVLCNSYRQPSLTAKMGASLQALSEGRFVLGYGAGWHKPEYEAYGFEFPSAATRVAMMEEGLQIIKTMWRDSPASWHGRFYHVEDARCEPRPDPMPPILIGGSGEQLTLRAVARHADWWNIYSRSAEFTRHKLAVLREHCDREGRDVASIRKTWAGPVFIDRDHEAAERLAADSVESDHFGIAGDPAAVREQIHAFVDMGFDMFQLHFEKFPDTSDMELFMSEVMPAFS